MKFNWGILALFCVVVSTNAYSAAKRKHVNKYAHLACKKTFTPTNTRLLEDEAHKLGLKESDLVYKEYEIATQYPKEVMNQALGLMRKGIQSHMLKNRRDMRKLPFFTIDGKETIDRDDAIYVQRKKNGNYLLHVAVPDMASFIKVNSPIWNWIINQTTSHYLRDQVIHMLPRDLVSGLLSIDPKVDRLAFVYIAEFDVRKKKYIDFKVERAILNSKKAFAYDEFQEKIDNPELRNGHERDAIEFYNILNKHFDKSISFPFNTEQRAVMDENGKVTGFKPLEKFTANHLIELFMISVNHSGGKFMEVLNIPGIFRSQEDPERQQIRRFYQVLSQLGLSTNYYESKTPLQNLEIAFNKLKKYKHPEVVMPLLFFLTNPAENTVFPGQHSFLNISVYSFLTSPLRRVSDFWNQIMFGHYLNGTLESSKEVFDLLQIQDVLVAKDNQNISNAKLAETQWQNMVKLKLNDVKVGFGYKAIVARSYKEYDVVYIPEKNMYAEIEILGNGQIRNPFAETGKKVFIQINSVDKSSGKVYADYR